MRLREKNPSALLFMRLVVVQACETTRPTKSEFQILTFSELFSLPSVTMPRTINKTDKHTFWAKHAVVSCFTRAEMPRNVLLHPLCLHKCITQRHTHYIKWFFILHIVTINTGVLTVQRQVFSLFSVIKVRNFELVETLQVGISVGQGFGTRSENHQCLGTNLDQLRVSVGQGFGIRSENHRCLGTNLDHKSLWESDLSFWSQTPMLFGADTETMVNGILRKPPTASLQQRAR